MKTVGGYGGHDGADRPEQRNQTATTTSGGSPERSMVGQTVGTRIFCPHCLEPIREETPVARCQFCRQAHHAQCWSARGGCATRSCLARVSGRAPDHDEWEDTELAEGASVVGGEGVGGQLVTLVPETREDSGPVEGRARVDGCMSSSRRGPAPLDQIERIATSYGLAEEAEKVCDRKRDAALPLLVVIAGEGNFGKSSLVNQLAGRKIAPVSVLPLTWKVDIYCQSDSGEEYAEVRKRGELDRCRMSLEEASSMCKEEEAALKRDASRKPTLVDVIWRYANLSFGSQVCLVDTPGLAAAGLGVQLKSERLVKGLGAVFRDSNKTLCGD